MDAIGRKAIEDFVRAEEARAVERENDLRKAREEDRRLRREARDTDAVRADPLWDKAWELYPDLATHREPPRPYYECAGCTETTERPCDHTCSITQYAKDRAEARAAFIAGARFADRLAK